MLVIGDEILSGHVPDRNSPWLAERLRALGVPLRSVQVVADDPADIDGALRHELARTRPRVVLTSGGIGTTPDDLTYGAIADSLGRELVTDPLLQDRIEGILDWSRAQGLDVTDVFAWHVGRMARVPADAQVLTRPGGWAAAVALDVDGGADAGGATVVILPGVPAEFRALVSDVVEPLLLVGRNPVPAIEEIEHAFPESALNETFVTLLERFPDVKLGSYPGRPMLVRLTGDAERVSAAAALVRDGIDRLASTEAGRRLQAAWAARAHGDADPEVGA